MLLTPEEWEIIGLSLRVSLVAVGLTMPVAFAIAWALARGRFPGKVLLDALVHLPLVLPPVVTGWLLLLLFGNNTPVGHNLMSWFGFGFIFRWTGAALAAAIMALPLMVRTIRLSLDAIDPRFENAARTLGATPWNSFVTITLPLALPGLLAAMVLGFARSLGEFGATITFVSNIPGETRTLPLAIYSALQTPNGDTMVVRLSLVAIGLSLCALIVAELLVRGKPNAEHARVV